MALSLVFVIINAVDIDYTLVVLARVTLNLYGVRIWSRLNLSLAIIPTVEDQCLLLLADAGVLGGLVLWNHLVLAGRVSQDSWVHQGRWRLLLMIESALANTWPGTPLYVQLATVRWIDRAFA